MAEKRPAPPPVLLSGEPEPAWEKLYQQLEQSRALLDELIVLGAQACLPAHVMEARLRDNRIVRELHGGLQHDAAQNLVAQQHALLALELRLRAVKRSGNCQRPISLTFQQTTVFRATSDG